MRFVECNELGEGKTVQIGDIIFVGTKTQDEYPNKELKTMKVA